MAEEPPQYDCVPKQTAYIAHHHLRPKAPPEEAKVAGVPQPAVDAVRDENMSHLLPGLHEVIEVCTGMRHAECTCALAQNKHRESQAQPSDPGSPLARQESIEWLQIQPARIMAWGDILSEDTFHESQGVRQIIRVAISTEQKSADCGRRRIMLCGDVVFEKVEKCENGEEEGSAP
ncbi:MAG: hypothetical protein Q9220_007452 [cf. Caloplaca sp. 1 TL-2023]